MMSLVVQQALISHAEDKWKFAVRWLWLSKGNQSTNSQPVYKQKAHL